MPSRLAPSVTDRSNGLKQSSRTMAPGWTGVFIAMAEAPINGALIPVVIKIIDIHGVPVLEPKRHDGRQLRPETDTA